MSSNPQLEAGQSFRELRRETDPITGREVWCLTSVGDNDGISFHYGAQFTSDSRYLVFRRQLGEQVAVLRADMATGELLVVAVGPAALGACAQTIPGRQAAAVLVGGQVQAVDLVSLKSELLFELPAGYGTHCIFGTLDGLAVGCALYRHLPYTVAKSHTYDTAEFEAYVREFGGRPGRIDLAELGTGRVRTVWEEPHAAGNHVQPSPVDPEVWLVERDQPPLFSWMGDHGRTPRVWLVNWRTGQARPVPTRNDNHFHMHSCWSHDGRYVYYHGRDRATGAPLGKNGGGHFIGAARVDGNVVWEQVYPHYYYGHVSSHTRRHGLMIDSLVTPDLVLEIEFLADGAPMRVLGRHGSVVTYGQQKTHPHPQMSLDGRAIAYNRSNGTRADVCVLWLA